MLYRQGGLTILSEGRALGRAALGENVTVMNLALAPIRAGRVTSFGQVEVGRMSARDRPLYAQRNPMRPAMPCLSCLPLLACEPLSEVGAHPISRPPRKVSNMQRFTACRCPRKQKPTRRGIARRSGRLGTLACWATGALLAPGDILTVVIEIDDSAQISNSTARGRRGTTSMAGPSLFGIPRRSTGGCLAG